MITHCDTPTHQARWRAAFAPAALGIVLLAITTPLGAQKSGPPSWVFQAYALRKDPTGSPLFGGMAITHYRRMLGVRLGGALHFESGNSQAVCDLYGCQEPVNFSLTAWKADADLILDPLRVIPVFRKLLLGFSPYGFVGIGGQGLRRDVVPDTSIATFSYGAGVHHALFGPLGIQAEARYRRPIQNDNGYPEVIRANLEYSVGLKVGFGGHKSSKAAKATKSAPPTETRAPSPRAPVSDEAAARFASNVLDIAESYLDKPYTYGGASPYGGFDAAGFVQYVFARGGVRLPRTAREISTMGASISLKVGSLRPGDLVFFASDGSTINHVAIYAGHDRIIHSTASGGGVRYDILGEGDRGQWFAAHLVAATRIAGGDGVPRTPDPSSSKALDAPDMAPSSTRSPR